MEWKFREEFCGGHVEDSSNSLPKPLVLVALILWRKWLNAWRGVQCVQVL